ncbi:hypothetical protein PVAND_005059 [Polypedilum vanderplanki]|uniref:ADAM10 endopeptidase n=1 Tax=Polypedilum vanderplanki TaxID=319348 RepID=A0A9J6BZF6_POLVA|nr:hypothetical protein PVAND_005059 [Polypedilum vanderplanki]
MKSKCRLIAIWLMISFNSFIETGYVKENGKRLNEYISHFETLSYDTKHLHAKHNRAKRSIGEDQHVHLKFSAHGETFHLRLKRDLTTFSDNLEIHHTDNGVESKRLLDTSHIYEGHVLGDKDSYVHGSISDGVFHGRIITNKDSYFVEKAQYYFPNHSHVESGFHSIIYKDQHVDDPYRFNRTVHPNGCGLTDDVAHWMDRVQSSADVLDEEIEIVQLQQQQQQKEKEKKDDSKSHSYQHVNNQIYDESAYEKYSKEANSRPKRATVRYQEKNTCSLYIQTDPLIWRHIRESIPDHNDPNRAAIVDEKAKEEILSLVAHHVAAVNFIYRNTKFDGRVEHRNIRFEVQRIKIDDDSACSIYYRGEPNQFCMENIDVSNFLNLHSLGNHEHFCLAYVFTYRDFTGGTLGLAWVASASGASGGICEKYKSYTETTSQGMYHSTKRSLNTGIITFVNYNSRVPPKVSQLTLAHEIGHNFGSPHDYPPECRPGGQPGNYIMFSSATSGDRPNNSKFSQCSIRNISNVLDAIDEAKKRNCFKVSEGAFCGNKIVEIGEECDCGFNDEECRDRCCYPRIVSDYDLNLNASAKGCSRRAKTQCSPSQGPCCDPNSCTFVPINKRAKCREESECSWSSMCNGTTSECPDPKPREDKTKCNNGTQLCISGECTGSICLSWNKTECFLSSTQTNYDKRRLCELACQDGNDVSTCRSTSEFGHLYGLPKGGISLRPGSPCDNFQGYCDVFLKCRAVDADGPLVRLKNLLLNRETLHTLKQYVIENWYFCVLMAIIFFIFMGIFIKCCAVHTPSSNPKKAPARRISDTLRRPMNTLRRMRHPANVARSIPPPGHGERRNRSRSGGNRQAGSSGGQRPISHHGGRRPVNSSSTGL